MRGMRKEDIESLVECNRLLKQHLDYLRKKVADQEVIIEFLGEQINIMNEELENRKFQDLYTINPN